MLITRPLCIYLNNHWLKLTLWATSFLPVAIIVLFSTSLPSLLSCFSPLWNVCGFKFGILHKREESIDSCFLIGWCLIFLSTCDESLVAIVFLYLLLWDGVEGIKKDKELLWLLSKSSLLHPRIRPSFRLESSRAIRTLHHSVSEPVYKHAYPQCEWHIAPLARQLRETCGSPCFLLEAGGTSGALGRWGSKAEGIVK